MAGFWYIGTKVSEAGRRSSKAQLTSKISAQAPEPWCLRSRTRKAGAFIPAGGLLLVSDWPVVSTAATEITTHLFEETAGTAAIGRAEALRRSMLALMETPDKPYYAHPPFWAPLVVVGEGAAP